MVEAVKSGFRFDPLRSAGSVSRDPRSKTQIAEALGGMVGARKKVPGTSVQQPLIELLVHGQDIAVPLGIDLPCPRGRRGGGKPVGRHEVSHQRRAAVERCAPGRH